MQAAEKQEVDLEAVRAKYRAERDKRIRADGNEQYKEVTGDFAYFVDDPYIDEVVQRGPEKRDVGVVIIGGGFGGMLAAVRLKQQGIDDVLILEKGGDFGGSESGITTLASPSPTADISFFFHPAAMRVMECATSSIHSI